MSITKASVISALSPPLPQDVVMHILDEYQDIKQQLALRRFRPTELNGGRFAECVLRLVQHLDNPPHTPFGQSLGSGAPQAIARRIENNTNLHESLRFFIPRLALNLLDLRNRRDVAHVGGDVSPNLADSVFVSHVADWTLTEIIRLYYNCTIDTAQKIINSINEVQLPIVADIEGFVRVQNTALDFRQKTLVIMYYKYPAKVRDSALFKWTEYSAVSAYRKNILAKLHADALVHYEDEYCTLLPKGISFVEKNIPLDFLV